MLSFQHLDDESEVNMPAKPKSKVAFRLASLWHTGLARLVPAITYRQSLLKRIQARRNHFTASQE